VLGIGLVVALIGGSTLILMIFGGTFSSYATVQAELPASSTAVALDSPVEYRDVQIGKVVSQGRTLPNGLVEVTLHLTPSDLRAVPAGVRATVAPVSIFGNQYVVLQSPARPGPRVLRAGDTIAAVRTTQTASLQSTLGSIDHLLIALHPAQLDAALTAFADALRGQGRSLGQTLDGAQSYLHTMSPLWPTVVSDLRTLEPVADQITTSTPDILQLISNFSSTSDTLTGTGNGVRDLLAGGARLSSQAAQLVADIQRPFDVLASATGPFLGDLSQRPDQIAQLLGGLASWAKAWTAAESAGPYLSVNVDVTVKNPADLGLALIGGPEAVADLSAGFGPGYVNPPTYTAADCPRFGSLHGSGCPVTLAEPAQQDAVADITHAITGVTPPSASVATLLLSPVLEHLVGGA
jgi:phospholipid/cholesterol/gamma-HCH transport system substrate-binding protein